jgi:hypothetical protein
MEYTNYAANAQRLFFLEPSCQAAHAGNPSCLLQVARGGAAPRILNRPTSVIQKESQIHRLSVCGLVGQGLEETKPDVGTVERSLSRSLTSTLKRFNSESIFLKSIGPRPDQLRQTWEWRLRGRMAEKKLSQQWGMENPEYCVWTGYFVMIV